jgi:hypothetical protein
MAAEVGQDPEFLEVAASLQEAVVPSNRKRRKKKTGRATNLAPRLAPEQPVIEPRPVGLHVQAILELQQPQSEWRQFGTVAVSVTEDATAAAAARSRRREQEAYDRELSKRRRQRSPADELLFHSLGRTAYCWKVRPGSCRVNCLVVNRDEHADC